MSADGEAIIQNLIEVNVRAIVDCPDEVTVGCVRGQHSCVFELNVNKSDIGKVIGKRGVHAQALRTLMMAAGGKHKLRSVLEILEDR